MQLGLATRARQQVGKGSVADTLAHGCPHRLGPRAAPFAPRSAQKPEQRAVAAVTAGVVSGVGAMMANPLVAEAAVTPSLKNFLYSLVAGGFVLAAIAGAITAVSTFDPVKRG